MKTSNVIELMAEKANMTPDEYKQTIKDTVFKQKDGKTQVTDAQFLMLMHIANKYDLDPFLRQIYAYPDRSGIVPVVGIDGWASLVNRQKTHAGTSFKYSEKMIKVEHVAFEMPEWIECTIKIRLVDSSIAENTVREYLREVYRIFKKDGKVFTGPWQTHTSRMLRHKAFIQCARLAYGFSGIYDEDEAQNIIEGEKILNTENQQNKTQLTALLSNSNSNFSDKTEKAEETLTDSQESTKISLIDEIEQLCLDNKWLPKLQKVKEKEGSLNSWKIEKLDRFYNSLCLKLKESQNAPEFF